MVETPMRHLSLLLLPLLLLLVTPCFAAGESGGQTILKESASGRRNLRPFTVKDKWELRWDSTGSMSVWLYTAKGEIVVQLAAQDKPGIGSTFYPTGGSYFLHINSRGDWTITVIQLP